MRNLTLLALALGTASPAYACGGFFCNLSNRVDQAAERIVFGIDTERGKVETHVQITYEGKAEEFAWIVPAPAEPELFTSSPILFDALENATAPRFVLNQSIDCDDPVDMAVNDSGSMDTDMADGGGGVTLVADQRVGPYDTVTLQATSETELVQWLQDNGYDIPDTLAEAMAPYIASGSYFVALKLAKGADTGDLTPLGMRYDGANPVVPLQLTSVAATPDMGLRIWVMSNGRAVPDNYLHVELNPLAFDWLALGSNYFDVIRDAADEAGGQAFATDYAGSTELVDTMIDPAGWRRYLDDIRGAESLGELMNQIGAAGLAGYPSVTTELEGCLMLDQDLVAAGATPTLVLTEPWNWGGGWDSGLGGGFDVPGVTVDGDACAAALESRVIEPAESAKTMISRSSWMTRLSSSMSPEEMTADPMFVINPDMEEVSNVHTAELIFGCDMFSDTRRLILEDGTELELPSQEDLGNRGETFLDVMGGAADFKALRIEDTSAAGPPVVISDNAEAILDALESDVLQALPGGEAPEPSGCGCNAGNGGAAGMLALLPWLFGRRRRAESRSMA